MLRYRPGKIPEKKEPKKVPQKKHRRQYWSLIPYRLSLRYKLAFPTLIIVCFMLVLIFRTTYHTVSGVVRERNESRLVAIAEVFAETVKVPLILDNRQVLDANIEWMGKREDVLDVRVEDSQGTTASSGNKHLKSIPEAVLAPSFFGVDRINQDVYAVAVPIVAHNRRLGRVLILFSQQGIERELRVIFEDRLQLAFVMAVILAFATAGVTWLAIRPIFTLRRTTEEILAGDLSARADIYSFDEIQDLGEAFNEMVARLARSLDSLRSRTEALEESEEKYRQIVDNASDIIFTLTEQGGLVLLNRGFSGLTREDLLKEGLPVFLSVHDEASKERFETSIQEIIRTRKPVNNVATLHIHRGNRAEIYYQTNLSPVLDHLGNVKYIQGVMRDVTEMRRIDLMKENLIRDVAHELKTPAAKFEMAITWFEKEMLKHGEAEKYANILFILKTNIDRLTRTITSIMDLSRLESGMQKIMMDTFNLNDVLQQVAADMEPICRQKKLKLESYFSRVPLMMKGDRDMLYRLFVNLISNSAKFTLEGQITLRSMKESGKILVWVQDTGPGIEKEFLEKVFERFFQKTASTVGIGVGLTISRDIAAIHQGRIWAESEGLGKGAVFKVEFPAL